MKLEWHCGTAGSIAQLQGSSRRSFLQGLIQSLAYCLGEAMA